MNDIVFFKKDFSYTTEISTADGSIAEMDLDTGSPITIISIPILLQITKEPLFSLRNRITDFLASYHSLDFGVYGSQATKVRHSFIPYIIKELNIGGMEIPYFMFWLDISNYKDRTIPVTSTLFGFDYIRQGEKTFDPKDNFHIKFPKKYKLDTFEINYALSSFDTNILAIDKLIV